MLGATATIRSKVSQAPLLVQLRTRLDLELAIPAAVCVIEITKMKRASDRLQWPGTSRTIARLLGQKNQPKIARATVARGRTVGSPKGLRLGLTIENPIAAGPRQTRRIFLK